MPRLARRAAALLTVVGVAALLPLPATALDAARSATPGTVLATIPLGPKPQDAVVSADGRFAYVTTLTDGMLTEIDLETFAVTRTLEVGDTAGAVLVFDGEIVVADASLQRLAFVDPVSFTTTRVLPVGVDPIALTSSPVGPNGPLIVFSAFEGRVLGVVPMDMFQSHTMSQGGKTWGVALFDDGTKMVSADTTNGRIILSDPTLGSGGMYATVNVGGRPAYVAVAPDESVAYVANADNGTVDVVDLAANSLRTSYSVGGKPWGVAVSWDGDYLYVPDNSGGTVIAVDARSGSVLSVTPTGAFPDFVALSPDGTLVLVPNSGSDSLSIVQGYSSPPSSPGAGDGSGSGGGAEEPGGDAVSETDPASGGGTPIWVVVVIVGVAVLLLAVVAVVILLVVRGSRRAAPTGPMLDPATSPAELARLAESPELRAAVAAHPNAYPELLAWLGGLGDPAVDRALRARR